MNLIEKTSYRNKVLGDLYNHNEKNNGKVYPIDFSMMSKEEGDKLNLALEYLSGKSFIEYKILTKAMYQAKITSYGIDFVEEKLS